MNKITLSTLLLMITTLTINSNTFEDMKTSGYLRTAYEIHAAKKSDAFKDGAIGGKLHIETGAYEGISLGTSFYTSNALDSDDNQGLVPFRGEVDHSYAIVGEAYMQAQFGNTIVKVGRQEIDTPFAQVDDIGVVPNTFEAYILQNIDILDTTLFLGQIQKMAGVDAEVVDVFTPVNAHNNMQAVGATYEGVENLTLSTWYYRMKDAEVDSIAYMEADYETERYSIGLQVAKQGYTTGKDATVFGITASTEYAPLGLTFSASYNRAWDNASFSGFGGGPFFANSEYLIPDNAGADGEQSNVGIAWDATTIGIENLSISLNHAILKNQAKQKATETDLVLGYTLGKHFETHLIASNIKGEDVGEDDARHMRVFLNYNF